MFSYNSESVLEKIYKFFLFSRRIDGKKLFVIAKEITTNAYWYRAFYYNKF